MHTIRQNAREEAKIKEHLIRD